jgi:integrase
LAFTYGWRKSELLGLRVRQVNVATREVRLDPGTTKNDDGREVKMSSKVRDLLAACCAGKQPNDYVLTRVDKYGHHHPVKDFRKEWKKLTTKAELPGLYLHDFRRSAAKALRRAGVPESVVMAIGGWKTPAMFRRYAIVSSADQEAAIAQLEQAREQSNLKVALIEGENEAGAHGAVARKPQ